MHVEGILLAAGSGRRFGQDKRIYRLPDGDTLLESCLAKLSGAVDHVIVVLRPGDGQLAVRLQGPRVSCCVNPRPADGMGSSLACAVRASADADAWLVMPADLPLLRGQTIRQVRESLHGEYAVVPLCHGARGHPVAFPNSFAEELAALDGETGGRSILRKHPERVHWLNVHDPGIHRDLDSVDDLSVLSDCIAG